MSFRASTSFRLNLDFQVLDPLFELKLELRLSVEFRRDHFVGRRPGLSGAFLRAILFFVPVAYSPTKIMILYMPGVRPLRRGIKNRPFTITSPVMAAPSSFPSRFSG